jgi:hypothetical protein
MSASRERAGSGSIGIGGVGAALLPGAPLMTCAGLAFEGGKAVAVGTVQLARQHIQQRKEKRVGHRKVAVALKGAPADVEVKVDSAEPDAEIAEVEPELADDDDSSLTESLSNTSLVCERANDDTSPTSDRYGARLQRARLSNRANLTSAMPSPTSSCSSSTQS